jgi:hypothetical protein
MFHGVTQKWQKMFHSVTQKRQKLFHGVTQKWQKMFHGVTQKWGLGANQGDQISPIRSLLTLGSLLK